MAPRQSYLYNQRPNTFISPSSHAVLQSIRAAEYAVLVGKNNCGKTFLLKFLAQQNSNNVSYLGPARYQNFNLFGSFAPLGNRRQTRVNELLNYLRNTTNQNMDNSPLNLQQAIAELSDAERGTLGEVIKILLGTDIEILLTDPNNSMSQRYFAAGGHNLAYTSSGFRLVTTLVTSLLDKEFDTFLVDEPELGISPEVQGVLADFLFDSVHRQRYFPHIKTLVFATHSTIFLDRNRIGNNYVVEKEGDEISLTQVNSQEDFNKIHFFLLGNRFETLYLPSLIILVEGKSDYAFVQRVLATRFPAYRLSVINANSDSRMKEIVNTAKNILSDIQKSPYHDRIIALVDSVHGTGLKDSLTSMGLLEENILVWSKNGIEHVYPPSLLDQIFGCGGDITIVDDNVTRNGLTYKKAELAEKICQRFTPDTPLHREFEENP